MLRALTVVAAALAFLAGVPVASAARDPNECSVCIKVVGDIIAGLTPAEKKDLVKIEDGIGRFCEKPMGEKETKLCYFIDPIKREISQPAKNGVPVASICQRLKKKSAEICTLKYGSDPSAGVSITKDSDLSKLRLKDLKAFLMEKQVPTDGLIEKDDFVAKVKSLFDAKKDL